MKTISAASLAGPRLTEMNEKSECKLCLSSLGKAEWDMHRVDQVLKLMIAKYLWAELIAETKDFLFTICNNCWTVLTEFDRFYCVIEKLHSQSYSDETKKLKHNVNEDPSQTLKESDVDAVHGQPPLTPVLINCDEFHDVNTQIIETSRKLNRAEKDDENDEGEERETIFSEKTVTKTEERQRQRAEEDATIRLFYPRIVCEACDLERMTRGDPAIVYESWSALLAHSRRDHAEVHSRVRTFVRCPVCDKRLLTRVKLLHHCEFHQHPERFRCAICSEVHENMKEHEQNKHQRRQFACEVCGKRFPFKERLAVHRKKMHLQKDVICDQCQKPFSRYAIDDHKRSVHIARFACEQCPKTFKIRYRFLQHLEKHNGDGTTSSSVPCTVCGQVMRDKYSLNRHMKQLHTEQPPVSCGSCGKSFKNKRNLATHMTNVCTAPSHTFDCAACGRQFRRRVKLKEHMATHTGKSLYVCSFCPETFRQDTHMYYHRKKAHHEQWLEMQRQRKEGVRFKVPEAE